MKLKAPVRFVLIALVFVAVIFGAKAIWPVLKDVGFIKSISQKAVPRPADTATNNPATRKDTKAAVKAGTKVFRQGVVDYDGMMPGIYFNGGLHASTASRYYTDPDIPTKILVEFTFDRNPSNLVTMFMNGQLDATVLTTDALPLKVNGMREKMPIQFLKTDVSFGADMIWVKPVFRGKEIRTINDLRGLPGAYVSDSPSLTFTLAGLETAGMTEKDVELHGFNTPDDVATAFQTSDYAFCTLWGAPIAQVAAVEGAYPILDTSKMSDLLAGVMFTSKEYADANPEVIDSFLRGWFKAVAEITTTDAGREACIAQSIELFQLPDRATAEQMFAGVHLATLGDNKVFFGVQPQKGAMTGFQIWTKFGQKYLKHSTYWNTNGPIPSWAEVSNKNFVENISMTGPGYAARGEVQFEARAEDKTIAPSSIKPIYINFETNSSTITAAASEVIQNEFGFIYKASPDARFRLEGNTDNRGSDGINIPLSKRRAEAVRDEIIRLWGGNKNRFTCLGLGSTNPMPGYDPNSTEGRDKNRRVEIKILSQ